MVPDAAAGRFDRGDACGFDDFDNACRAFDVDSAVAEINDIYFGCFLKNRMISPATGAGWVTTQ